MPTNPEAQQPSVFARIEGFGFRRPTIGPAKAEVDRSSHVRSVYPGILPEKTFQSIFEDILVVANYRLEDVEGGEYGITRLVEIGPNDVLATGSMSLVAAKLAVAESILSPHQVLIPPLTRKRMNKEFQAGFRTHPVGMTANGVVFVYKASHITYDVKTLPKGTLTHLTKIAQISDFANENDDGYISGFWHTLFAVKPIMSSTTIKSPPDDDTDRRVISTIHNQAKAYKKWRAQQSK